MINIAAIYPNIRDICSFYRGHGPLSQLRQLDERINIIPIDASKDKFSSCWTVIKDFDIIFIQRPFDDFLVNFFQRAKDMGKKIWIDYDDLLTNIPLNNGAIDPPDIDNLLKKDIDILRNKIQEKFNAGFSACIKYADIVTVSTEFLKRAFIKYHSDIYVIPNAFDDYVLDTARYTVKPYKKIISWRGSRHHFDDLKEFEKEIIKIDDIYSPEWHWYQLNYRPITDTLKKIRFFKSVEMYNYFNNSLRSSPASISICPLFACPFNFAKSDIAAIEAAWSGSITIAPNWPEWNKMNIPFLYKDKNEFISAAETALTNQKIVMDTAKKNWEYVINNRLLSSINKLRLDIIYKILKK